MDIDHPNELLSDEDRRLLVARIASEIKAYKYAGIFLNLLTTCFVVAAVVVGFIKTSLLVPFISIGIVALIFAVVFYFVQKPFQRTLQTAQYLNPLEIVKVEGVLKRSAVPNGVNAAPRQYIYTVGDTDLPHIIHGYEDTVLRAYEGQVVMAEYIAGVSWNKSLRITDGGGYDFLKQKPIVNGMA